MSAPWSNRKTFWVIASVLACTAVAVSLGLAYPTPVASPQLGAGWQCQRSVGIVTTCHRVSHVAPTSHYRPVQVFGAQEA